MNRDTHCVARSKHQGYIDDLAQQLSSNQRVLSVEKNVEYCRGECDLLVRYLSGKVAYWEIKSNHTEKGYKKTVKQLKRWSKHFKYDKSIGVYWTPQCMKVMYVNGVRR